MIKASKRIIFIPFIAAFGGAERLILDLSRFLHDIEVPHTIACFKQSIDLQSYSDQPLDVLELGPRRNALLEAKALNRFLRSRPLEEVGWPLLFDLKSAFYSGMAPAGPFVLHLTDPPSLLPADISKYASSARRHLPEFSRLPPMNAQRLVSSELVHRLNRRGARRASKVIVMTEKIRAELRELYDVDAVVVRPGISKCGSAASVSHKRSASLRILSVCRLESNKRIDWILRALATINAKNVSKSSNWTFEVVGDGAEIESLKKLAVELGLQDRAIFLGHVSDQQLAEAYSRANLFLMPAIQGYGLPALEALSRRIPTIVHQDSGVSEILAGNPWVEIIDGNNGSLSNAIAVMLDRLENNVLTHASIPIMPTSSGWARAACHECRWLTDGMS